MDARGMSGVVRGQFPCFSYEDSPVLLENAGGSQCPGVVIDAISEYMRRCYVQPGAGYELSGKAIGIVLAAHRFMKDYMNADETGEVVFGASTSQLLMTLSGCLSQVITEEDEVIVQETNHEANAGPWERLASDTGAVFKIWKMNQETFECSLEALGKLLSPRTRVVAVTHVSNLLGGILELDKVVRMVKERTLGKGRVVADGVAFAPHRALDVKTWGVDWYVFSSYKAYGPHMAVMFGTHEAFGELEGPNFYFVPRQDARYKFELGGVNHESCAGVLALWDYLKLLARLGGSDGDYVIGDRKVIEGAFEKVVLLEEPLQTRMLRYLQSKDDVVVVGPGSTDVRLRVPTVSFIHRMKRSSDIVKVAQSAGFGIRHGHMYAHRLITALHSAGKLYNNTVNDGVVRVSMVHYNTVEEVEKLIDCLETVL